MADFYLEIDGNKYLMPNKFITFYEINEYLSNLKKYKGNVRIIGQIQKGQSELYGCK